MPWCQANTYARNLRTCPYLLIVFLFLGAFDTNYLSPEITCPLKLLVPCISSSTLRSCCCQGQAVGVLRVLGRVPMLRKVCTLRSLAGGRFDWGARYVYTPTNYSNNACAGYSYFTFLNSGWGRPGATRMSEHAYLHAQYAARVLVCACMLLSGRLLVRGYYVCLTRTISRLCGGTQETVQTFGGLRRERTAESLYLFCPIWQGLWLRSLSWVI